MESSLLSNAFFQAQNVPKSVVAGSSPQTPLENLQHFPYALAGFKGHWEKYVERKWERWGGYMFRAFGA